MSTWPLFDSWKIKYIFIFYFSTFQNLSFLIFTWVQQLNLYFYFYHSIHTLTFYLFLLFAAAVWRGYLCWDPNQQQPLLLLVRSVVDDLTACQTGVAVEHFGGLGISLHAPVVDSRVRHQGDGVYRDPLPEHDVLRHCVSLHLALHLDVKDLQRLRSCGAAGKQGRRSAEEHQRGFSGVEEGHGQDEDDDSWMIKPLLLFDTLDELHCIYCLQLKGLTHYMTLLHFGTSTLFKSQCV